MTGPTFEVVVADQSGGENVKRMLSAYDVARFRHVVDDGRGRGRAIVCGASRARGKYLAITDDDVIVEPNWLSAALHCFGRHSPCDAVVGRISPFREKLDDDPQQVEWDDEQPLSATTVWYGFGANQVFRREAWDAVGGMDPRCGVGGRCPTADDSEILYRMFMQGYTLWYDPSVRIWHDGWEPKEIRAAKMRKYNVAGMAVAIKCWAEVGGPAPRELAARTLRLWAQGLHHLARRRRGTAAACFRKGWNYVSGIPMGISLAMEGRPRKVQ
jgi:GT2 family glycosyltransferase